MFILSILTSFAIILFLLPTVLCYNITGMYCTTTVMPIYTILYPQVPGNHSW